MQRNTEGCTHEAMVCSARVAGCGGLQRAGCEAREQRTGRQAHENSAQDGQAHEEAHVHNPADLIGRRNGRGLCVWLALGQRGDSRASVRAQGASTAPAHYEQHHSPIVVRSSRLSEL